MVPDYTYDGGHLNETGRNKVAKQLLILLAKQLLILLANISK
jgi:lysophospholipase L1-like esterase